MTNEAISFFTNVFELDLFLVESCKFSLADINELSVLDYFAYYAKKIETEEKRSPNVQNMQSNDMGLDLLGQSDGNQLGHRVR